MKFTDREMLIVMGSVVGGIALKGTYNLLRDYFKKDKGEEVDDYDDEEEEDEVIKRLAN